MNDHISQEVIDKMMRYLNGKEGFVTATTNLFRQPDIVADVEYKEIKENEYTRKKESKRLEARNWD